MSASVISNEDQGRRLLEQQLAGWWAAALGNRSIGVDDDIFRHGCDPENGAAVLDRIRRELQVEIPVSDLFEARTIAKLADLIEIRQASMDSRSVIPIRQGSGRQPLVLVHGVGGNLLGFVTLVRLLKPDQPVYGIQSQALHNNNPVLVQLEAMAAYYVRELKAVQPHGPYAFLGLSFGGLVAYEMSQQLVAAGEKVNLLGLLDTWQPEYMRQQRMGMPLPGRLLHRVRMMRLNTRKLSLGRTVRYTLGRLKSRLLRLMYLYVHDSKPVSLPGSMRRVREINLMAGARYSVQPYPGEVTLFRALDDSTAQHPQDLGWRSYAQGGVEIVSLPGDHGQVLTEPNVSYLAEQLTTRLNALPEQLKQQIPEARIELELFGREWVEYTPVIVKTEKTRTRNLKPHGVRLADHESALTSANGSHFAFLSEDQTWKHGARNLQ